MNSFPMSSFSSLRNAIMALFFVATFAQFSIAQKEIEKTLYDLPDVIFHEIEAPEGYEAAYELHIKQPIDHQNPEAGYFYQRAFLSHKGFDRPTVIATEGYQRPANRMYELSQLLSANQLDVEHRFFGASIPDSANWKYLNLENATADLHHIKELFGQLYNGKWISTGISKGGQTTIFYRYFYPNDVDVSVPYVAPLNLSTEDQRIYTFLDTVCSDECRKKIQDFQKAVLKKRDEILPRLYWQTQGAKLDFNYLPFEKAFEYAVLEYSFSFWQWGAHCEDIPPADAPADSLLAHLLAVSGLDFFADESMKNYASHYYQAGSQMGYYGYRTEPFKGLLKALPMQPHPSAIFMPDKMPVTFTDDLVRKVYDWVNSHGNNMVFINGDSDTWSSTAVRPSGKTNAVFFFLPGKDHGQARIKNMTEAEHQKFVKTLEDWLGMDIK